jgi:DNA-binding MarR family transcriptional regulator
VHSLRRPAKEGATPDCAIPQLAEIDRIVHEPARYLIMAYLCVVDSADFIFLLHQTGLTKGNLSSHLAKLEQAGYIAVQKQFIERIPRTLLSLTPAGRAALAAYRDQMQRMLDGPA